jgi:hypothetical protein
MKSIRTVVGIAFGIRFFLLVLNSYFIQLPESGKDDRRFENLAWEWTITPPREMDAFAKSGAGLFIKCGSVLYKVIGRQPFVWGFILVLMGTAAVNNIYKATLLLWGDKKQAIRAAWIAALYPEFAMLSALTLREVVIHFFLSLAIVALIRYWKYKKVNSLLTFLLYMGIATLFHTAMVLGLAGFGLAVLIISQEGKKKSVFYKVAAFVLVAGGLVFINFTGIGLSKFGGSFDGAIDKFQTLEATEALGNAAYPDWLRMSGGASDLWKLPIRFVAFLFSPALPPMVKSASHAIGLIDALFYLYLANSIFKNRRTIKANKSAYVVVIISMVLALVFSLGVSNFGTAIRHRAKLLPLFLILAIDFKALRRTRRIKQQKDLLLKSRQQKTLTFNDVNITGNSHI